jgi:hypothetical protein
VILELDVEGDRAAAAGLAEMGRRAADGRRLFRHIAPAFYDAERRAFRRGFSRDGKHYTLIDSGRLMESLTRRRHPENVLDIGGSEMRFGTSVFYARFLRKRGFQPLNVDRLLRDDIEQRTREFIIGRTA